MLVEHNLAEEETHAEHALARDLVDHPREVERQPRGELVLQHSADHTSRINLFARGKEGGRGGGGGGG